MYVQESGVYGADQGEQQNHYLGCDPSNFDQSFLQRQVRSSYTQAGVSCVRQHQCPGCGKAFATSSGLKQHQHIHSSVKPFRCDVCHKAYTQFSNLCRHKRMHADCRQRIRCPDCDQTFATTTSLAKHRRFCDGLIRPDAVSTRRGQHQFVSHARDCATMTASVSDSVKKHVTVPSEDDAADLSDAPPLLQSLVSCGWKASSLAYPLQLMTSSSSTFNCDDHRDDGMKHDNDQETKKDQLIGMSTKQPSDFGIRRLLDCHSSDDNSTTQNGELEEAKEPASSLESIACDSDEMIDVDQQDEPLDLSTRSDARQTSPSGVGVTLQRWCVSESSPVAAAAAAERSQSDKRNCDTSLSYQQDELERSLMLSSMSLPASLLGSLFYQQLRQQRQTWTTDIEPVDVLQNAVAFGSKILSAQSNPLQVGLYHQSTLNGLPSTTYAVAAGTSLPLPMDASPVDVQKERRRYPATPSQRQQQPNRYGCRFCGKMFPRSANLTRHLRTHTGEQPYRCCYCDRSFSISSNLQRHVRNIHNRERPFSCPLCERCFGQQTNLDRHLKKHEYDASTPAIAEDPDHVAVQSPAGRDVAGESYLLELRRFVVRACGIDMDNSVHHATSVNGTELECELDDYRPSTETQSPSQPLIWSPARQSLLPPCSSCQDVYDSKLADCDSRVEVGDSEQSTASSMLEDDDGAMFPPLNNGLGLAAQSVVC